MNSEHPHHVEELAGLLRMLAPPPEPWVAAARDLPRLRRAADQILALAEVDAAFREALLEDLEDALASASFEPEPRLIEEVHDRLRRRPGEQPDE